MITTEERKQIEKFVKEIRAAANFLKAQGKDALAANILFGAGYAVRLIAKLDKKEK